MATSSASEVDLLGLGSVSAAPTRSPENQVFTEAQLEARELRLAEKDAELKHDVLLRMERLWS